MATIDPKHWPLHWPPEILTEALHAPLPPQSEIMEMLHNPDPWPHYVFYRPEGGALHVPPDHFYIGEQHGPSHCRWIVPGTAERRR